ncbi:YkgJ family cysteine cluster protein [Candidatus Woesearchaeota archaeon]|nr:YkgJ family cysteine cluster protein [Candidatus Woesearchaeota archaeon]
MTECDELYADFCMNACCYFPTKRLTPQEAKTLERFTVDESGRFLLENDPITGACVFLDVENGRCQIYEQRPAVCQGYKCHYDSTVTTIISDLRFGRRPFEDLLSIQEPRIK